MHNNPKRGERTKNAQEKEETDEKEKLLKSLA